MDEDAHQEALMLLSNAYDNMVHQTAIVAQMAGDDPEKLFEDARLRIVQRSVWELHTDYLERFGMVAKPDNSVVPPIRFRPFQ